SAQQEATTDPSLRIRPTTGTPAVLQCKLELVERAWRPCLAGTSNGRLAWLGKARARISEDEISSSLSSTRRDFHAPTRQCVEFCQIFQNWDPCTRASIQMT